MSNRQDGLEQKQAIIEVLVRYASAVDNRDYQMLERVFTEDVLFKRSRTDRSIEKVGQYPSGEPQEHSTTGREARIDAIRWYLAELGPTQHLLGNYRIEIDGNIAESVCSVRAFHVGIGAHEHLTYEVFGEYQDRLRKTGSGWRIFERTSRYTLELGSVELFARSLI